MTTCIDRFSGRARHASSWCVLVGVATGVLVLGVKGAAAGTDCPDDFLAYAGTTDHLACSCTKEAAEFHSWQPVYGMGVYTGDSRVCPAARHVGAIGENGGDVTVIPDAGRSVYPGVTRNGVTSVNHGTFSSSFRFASAAPTAPATPVPEPRDPVPDRVATSVSDCPDNFLAYAGTTEPLACSCSKEEAEFHSWQPVYGMGVYTGDSRVCPAARHVGAIGESGGDVTVIPDGGHAAYPGVTRNGVTSVNHGTFASSFRFASAAASAPASLSPSPGVPAQAKAAASVSDCPDDFLAYAGTTEHLACSCTKEEAEFHSWQPVYGMGVYTGDSRVCPAARQVGAIGEDGGNVTVIPDAGRSVYPGVTRNGVISTNHGAFSSSFRFASAAAPAVPGSPTPAPARATATISGLPRQFFGLRGHDGPSCVLLLERRCGVSFLAARLWHGRLYRRQPGLPRGATSRRDRRGRRQCHRSSGCRPCRLSRRHPKRCDIHQPRCISLELPLCQCCPGREGARRARRSRAQPAACAATGAGADRGQLERQRRSEPLRAISHGISRSRPRDPSCASGTPGCDRGRPQPQPRSHRATRTMSGPTTSMVRFPTIVRRRCGSGSPITASP